MKTPDLVQNAASRHTYRNNNCGEILARNCELKSVLNSPQNITILLNSVETTKPPKNNMKFNRPKQLATKSYLTTTNR